MSGYTFAPRCYHLGGVPVRNASKALQCGHLDYRRQKAVGRKKDVSFVAFCHPED